MFQGILLNEISSFIQAAPQVWEQFCTTNNLTSLQQQQFANFGTMLLAWNQKYNLTAITNVESVITDHFSDSLSITQFVDISAKKGICDVGTGGGFPGIPLKIMFPHVPAVLIEVNNKKISFLNHVIQELGLQGIEVYGLDWRTFIRKTNYDLDLFCARASLRPDELVKLFTERTSPYKSAQLVYWASRHWTLGDVEKPFFEREVEYTVGNKQRRLVFFCV